MSSYKISGQVIIQETKKGIPDLRIEAWDKDLLIDDRLGVAVSDKSGSFTIEFDERIYQDFGVDRSLDVYFKVFKGDRLLVNTVNQIHGNVQGNLENIVIPVPNDALVAASNQLKITGRIISDRGTTAAGIQVVAYDKRLSGDIVIGNAVTDEAGNYTISYSQEILKGKTSPDLEIRLMDAVNKKTEIGRSAVRYNAKTQETINVTVDSAKVASPTEYERLVTALTPHLEGKNLSELQENDERQDITYLANKSGWDARVVAMAAQAAKLSSQTKVPSSCYYALFRSGAAGSPESLSKLSPQYTEQVMKKAVSVRVIPDNTDISGSLKTFQTQNTEILLKSSSGRAVSNLNSMLDLRLNAGTTRTTTDDPKQLFMESYQQYGDSPARFWASLEKKGLSPDLISNLKLDGKLGYLTLQNAPLVKRLCENYKISDPADLVRAGLYKASEWEKLIGADLPKDTTLNDYAASMANLLILSYPTLVTGQMIKNKELNLGRFTNQDELYTFFDTNHSQYTIGVHPVKTWAGFTRLSADSQNSAKMVERLYQISPSNETMSTLSNYSLTSAYQIVKYTRQEFKLKYAPKFTNDREADLVYTKAHEIYSSTMNLATTYLTGRMAPNVYSITGQLEKQSSQIIAYPTLEELFGEMDYCACEECRSVLSPAAYLVDLLQFIDLKDIPYEKQNPIDVLLQRRPDIQHIQLTCENTNKVLPYLDLVNEILEHYIVNGNLITFKGHNIDAEVNPEDLLAEPQYVVEQAYVKTKEKVYPYNLPFDQPLEALRLLFQVWDTTLAEALDIFTNQLSARIASLGLNRDEYRILTDKTFHALPEYFGEAAGATLDGLNNAVAAGKTFAKRTGITYMELVELLKTQFINPGINLVPALERLGISLAQIQTFYNGTLTATALNALLPPDLILADYGGNVSRWLQINKTLIMGLITLTDMNPGSGDCSFADVQLRYALPDMANNKLTTLSYHKLHRFIRIWKKEGWSMVATDQIITTLSPTKSQDITEANLDATFVTLLARIANLKRLAAKRQISEKKLPNWLELWDTSKGIPIRLETLAKLVKMPVEDLSALTAITGIDPLVNDLDRDQPSLLQYLELIDNLKSVSLKITDLNYLLRHMDESGKLTWDETVLRQNIKILRDAVNAITAELNVAPDNADFSYAKTKMALVYDTPAVDKFFELLTKGKTLAAPLVMLEETLPKKLTDFCPSLGYDPYQKTLTYQGIMPEAVKTALSAQANTLTLALPSPDVTVIKTQVELNQFITNFNNALQVLRDKGVAELTNFAVLYPELKLVYDTVTTFTEPSQQIRALLDGILPELQGKQKGNALQQALTAILKCGPEITEALTKDAAVLHSISDIRQGILYDFLRLEEKTVFNSNQTYDFYLDVPATDNYLIHISAPQNTKVTLMVDGQKVIDAQPIGVSKEIQNTLPLSLQASNLCPVQLIISSLPVNSAAELSWRTKGMAKTAVPSSKMYRKETVDRAKTALLRLQKASQLQRLLKLTPSELAYFAATNLETKDLLNNLDTDGSINSANLHALWNKLYPLIYFTQLKNENEPETDTWVRILQQPVLLTPQGKSLLLGVTGWKEADLNRVLKRLRGEDAIAGTPPWSDLSRLSMLQKVKRAMDLVSLIDHPATDVINWTTDSPSSALIQEIKTRIRERCDDAAWLNTMQSVSDSLRNQSRDALITYILYYLKPSPEIDTADKLYEYFLVDVQMDAAMKTSRIKLALSTIQLFIQRCLMNLEPNVAPSSIRAQQWEWMKRYRVWEANRKIFLYPENWLEPELRDNKSSFFTELEGELLQADITDDLAERAFLNYLKKLDDVARLEIVGMYLQENEENNQYDDILHVFGRSNGNTRQYYYRRYDGHWSPWEKVSVTIEGEQVFPVIWKSRLFVFWLNIIEKPAEAVKTDTAEPNGVTFGGMADTIWASNAKSNVEINMCWAEYFKGKWTSPKSSDLKNPITFNGISSPFDPKKIILYAGTKTMKTNEKASERLIFNLFHTDYGRCFRITYTSKNAPPIVEPDQVDLAVNDPYEKNCDLFYTPYQNQNNQNISFIFNAGLFTISSPNLSLNISQPNLAEKPTVTEAVLTRSGESIGPFTLLPIKHMVENHWEAPFFYSDEQSTFFVKPEEVDIPPVWGYEEYYDFGTLVPVDIEHEPKIPPLQEVGSKFDVKGPIIDPLRDPLQEIILGEKPNYQTDPGREFTMGENTNYQTDPGQVFTMGGNTNLKTTLVSTGRFTFDQTTFGSTGKINTTLKTEAPANLLLIKR